MKATIGVSGDLGAIYASGLPRLQRVLDALAPGYVLVGGVAVQYWLTIRPVHGFAVRPTADIDIGVDRVAIGSLGSKQVVRPLLDAEGFRNVEGDEEFRFRGSTDAGPLVLDVLVAKGASRSKPPLAEEGLSSVAAPGLAYAFSRGPVPGEIEFQGARSSANLEAQFPTLDAAFVMKAALVESGVRTQPNRVRSDTADAVLLAAALVTDEVAHDALARNRKRSDVARAIKWFKRSFGSDESLAASRLIDAYDSNDAVELAMDVAGRL